jgi:hypothetical protein
VRTCSKPENPTSRFFRTADAPANLRFSGLMN